MEQISVLNGENKWVTIARVNDVILAVSDSETRELMRLGRGVYQHIFVPVFDREKRMDSFAGLNVEHAKNGKELDYLVVLSATGVVARTQVFVSALGGIYNMGDGVWAVPTWLRDGPESFVRGFGARKWHVELEQYITSALSYNGFLYLPMSRGSAYVINAQGKIVTYVPPKNSLASQPHGRVYVNSEGVFVEAGNRSFQFNPETGTLIREVW